MSDYISREAAVEIARKYRIMNGSTLGRHTWLADRIAFEIEGLPAADMEQERDGRLVVLPCKVGDVVYGFHGEKTILPMVAKWFETNTDGWCIAAQYVPMAPKFYRFSDFGKTVFLTREAAEKALEAMKNG